MNKELHAFSLAIPEVVSGMKPSLSAILYRSLDCRAFSTSYNCHKVHNFCEYFYPTINISTPTVNLFIAF